MTEQKTGRQRHRRFKLSLPLWVRFGAGQEHEPQDAAGESVSEEEQTTTTAISSGNCFFYVSKKPPLGAPARMVVEIPVRASGRGGAVRCKGRVVWVSDQETQGKVGVACTIDSYTMAPPGNG